MISLTVYDLKKPVITAYNGATIGMALTTTLSADIRIASENARFGMPFTRRAFVSEGASNWFLPRIVGMGKAAEWLFTGKIFQVQEALDARLVTEVLPQDRLIPRAREIAQEIVQNTSPVSVALCRQLLWKSVGTEHPMEAHQMESKALHWITKTPDTVEGVMSFMEKRKPNFPLKPSKDMPDFYPWWPERPFRS
jgi:enoyl-CoA hydratase/carnithine racemase